MFEVWSLEFGVRLVFSSLDVRHWHAAPRSSDGTMQSYWKGRSLTTRSASFYRYSHYYTLLNTTVRFASSEEEGLLLWGRRLVALRKKACCSEEEDLLLWGRRLVARFTENLRIFAPMNHTELMIAAAFVCQTAFSYFFESFERKRNVRQPMSNNVYKRYGVVYK